MTNTLNIAHIVPSSGGTFYCQNCIRDLALVPALRELGHDAYILPLYLPFQDNAAEGVFKDDSIFLGAVSLYLQDRYPLFKRIPRFLSKALDSKPLLKLAASQAGTTSADGLEGMTLSLLQGDKGNQKDGIKDMVKWIYNLPTRPDVFHISNALLLGLAPALKAEFDRPIVCSLQDEIDWIDSMRKEYTAATWELMRMAVPKVDAFSSVSRYYADVMQAQLRIPRERMHVIPIGIPLEHFYPSTKPSTNPPTIGFISKLSPQYGLDTLIDAFVQLKSERPFRELRLKLTGGITPDVKPFLNTCEAKLKRLGVWNSVELIEDFEEKKRGDFVRSLDILSVPVPGGEAFGTYQLEAMACGVPVVQPRSGAFTEIVQDTGGGILYSLDEPDGLANALRSLLSDSSRSKELGKAGRTSVQERYTVQCMADSVADLYTSLLEEKNDD